MKKVFEIAGIGDKPPFDRLRVTRIKMSGCPDSHRDCRSIDVKALVSKNYTLRQAQGDNLRACQAELVEAMDIKN